MSFHQGVRGRGRVVMFSLVAVLCGLAFFMLFRGWVDRGVAKSTANQTRITYSGISTNSEGQPCAQFKLRNGSNLGLMALIELEGSPEGAGLFVPLDPSGVSIVDVPLSPSTRIPPRANTTFFVPDTGLMTRVMALVDRLLAQASKPMSKVLFTVSGETAK